MPIRHSLTPHGAVNIVRATLRASCPRGLGLRRGAFQMSDDNRPPARKGDFDDRLRAARVAQAELSGRKGEPSSAAGREKIGIGMRIGVELVATLLIGTGIGFALDKWLGTSPWLVLVFLLLGSCAGILNVIRLARADDRRRAAEKSASGVARKE